MAFRMLHIVGVLGAFTRSETFYSVAVNSTEQGRDDRLRRADTLVVDKCDEVGAGESCACPGQFALEVEGRPQRPNVGMSRAFRTAAQLEAGDIVMCKASSKLQGTLSESVESINEKEHPFFPVFAASTYHGPHATGCPDYVAYRLRPEFWVKESPHDGRTDDDRFYASTAGGARPRWYADKQLGGRDAFAIDQYRGVNQIVRFAQGQEPAVPVRSKGDHTGAKNELDMLQWTPEDAYLRYDAPRQARTYPPAKGYDATAALVDATSDTPSGLELRVFHPVPKAGRLPFVDGVDPLDVSGQPKQRGRLVPARPAEDRTAGDPSKRDDEGRLAERERNAYSDGVLLQHAAAPDGYVFADDWAASPKGDGELPARAEALGAPAGVLATLGRLRAAGALRVRAACPQVGWNKPFCAAGPPQRPQRGRQSRSRQSLTTARRSEDSDSRASRGSRGSRRSRGSRGGQRDMKNGQQAASMDVVGEDSVFEDGLPASHPNLREALEQGELSKPSGRSGRGRGRGGRGRGRKSSGGSGAGKTGPLENVLAGAKPPAKAASSLEVSVRQEAVVAADASFARFLVGPDEEKSLPNRICGLDEDVGKDFKWVDIRDASRTFEVEVAGAATLNRGHNVPNGDTTWDEAAQHATFAVDANACPQEGHMNAHAWMCSEKVVHEYGTAAELAFREARANNAKASRSEINVVTGPLVCPKLFGAPGRMGAVECHGAEGCHGGNVIPQMFWKVVLDQPGVDAANNYPEHRGWGYLALNWCTEQAMSVSNAPLGISEVRDFIAWCEDRDPAEVKLFGEPDALGRGAIPPGPQAPDLCEDSGPIVQLACGQAASAENFAKCKEKLEDEGDGRGNLIWKHCCSKGGTH